MIQGIFQEKVEDLYRRFKPKRQGYGGPFIFMEQDRNVAFFTLVSLIIPLFPGGKESYRETVYIVWVSENGNLQQEEIVSLIGFFKTSLYARAENGYALLNIRCEGEDIHEFDFRIPLNIIDKWCEERAGESIILN